MPRPKRTIADVVREAALKEIHSDREIALDLVKRGLFWLPKRTRLDYGQCQARAKYSGKRCQAPALPCGKCKLHGG
jgi:hypothetical protein